MSLQPIQITAPNKRRILVVAPDYTEEELVSRADTSPAAAAWMRSFLSVLSNFAELDCSFWYAMESAWPRGRLFVNGETLKGGNRKRTLVEYVNLPKVKTLFISRSLSFEVLSNVSEMDDVVVYGQRTFTQQCMRKIASQARRVFLILPDAEPGQRGMQQIESAARHATGGVICLPAELASSLTRFRTISFQGVVSSRRIQGFKSEQRNTPVKRKLVFIGGVDNFSGARFLREALELARLENCEITVVGRVGDRAEAEKLRALGADVTGFVDVRRLEAECMGAFAFLNPRDPRLPFSERNFPSKLLLYMRFSRPIISTDTAGLPRSLADALDCNGIQTPADFARRVREVVTADEKSLEDTVQRLERLVNAEFAEEAVTEKLRHFFS